MNLFLKTLASYAKHVFGIWNEPRRYRQLYFLIREVKAKNIMEIGTWRGGRARQMIQEAQKQFPRQEVSYYGFDLFETLSPEMLNVELSKQPPALEAVRRELRKTGARISLYKGNTRQVLPMTVPSLPPMDFIFIDGGHSLETIQSDWDYASRLMHRGTIVVFDDYWPERTDAGAKPIVDAIDSSVYDVKILPMMDVFVVPHSKRLAIQFAAVRKRSHHD